jgi:hypothetical protein
VLGDGLTREGGEGRVLGESEEGVFGLAGEDAGEEVALRGLGLGGRRGRHWGLRKGCGWWRRREDLLHGRGRWDRRGNRRGSFGLGFEGGEEAGMGEDGAGIAGDPLFDGGPFEELVALVVGESDPGSFGRGGFEDGDGEMPDTAASTVG